MVSALLEQAMSDALMPLIQFIILRLTLAPRIQYAWNRQRKLEFPSRNFKRYAAEGTDQLPIRMNQTSLVSGHI